METGLNPLDWLPLLVVIIGAYLTYFYAIRLEDRKKRYDLKVKIYFELLDLISKSFLYKGEIYDLESRRCKIGHNLEIE